MSEDLRELAFRLHVRGFTSDQIASALQREHGATTTTEEVDAWVRERLEADPDSDPQHSRTVAVLAEASRELWKAAAVPNLAPADRARYLQAVARNEERLIKIDGRCGARLRGVNDGRFCMHFPVAGKRRCRIHGGVGGAPRGLGNGMWKHGARVTYITPLNETEAELLTRYEGMTRAQTATAARAKQALLHERAFNYAMHTGDMAAAKSAIVGLASILHIEHVMEKGYVVTHVLDESAIGVLVGLVFAVLQQRITDTALLAAIVDDLGKVDWSKATMPVLEETTAAVGEKS